MPNPYFQFKQFTVYHNRCAMKVTTDSCLFGAWCAKTLEGQQQESVVLDIGTGSGLLALMVAQKNKMHIDAIELDEEAAQQAEENVLRSSFKNIRVMPGDILQLPAKKQYDVILSNPPFYEDELQSAVATKNLAHHSSQLRFADLSKKINELLTSEGSFYLLLPYKRKMEIEKIFNQHQLFIKKEVMVRQTEKHHPFRWMIEGSKQPVDREPPAEIIIKEEGAYSLAFSSLLQDYYLYL